MDLCQADLRCLDAHVHLGNLAGGVGEAPGSVALPARYTAGRAGAFTCSVRQYRYATIHSLPVGSVEATASRRVRSADDPCPSANGSELVVFGDVDALHRNRHAKHLVSKGRRRSFSIIA